MPTSPPICSLWVNGLRFADGQVGEDPTDPVALSGLAVTWGRSSVVDQPAPSTCAFEVLDLAGGRSFREVLKIGAHVDVRAEASLWSDTETPMLPADPWTATELVNARRLADGTLVPIDPHRIAAIRFLPGPATSDPTGWTGLPVAKPGEPYFATVGVRLEDLLASGAGTVTVHPAYWTDPTKPPTTGTQLAAFSGAGTHGITHQQFAPVAGTWVGLEVRITNRPRWDDVVDTLRWDDLAPAVPTLTNLATNPTPASVNGWLSNDPAQWMFTYAAGEISVQALPGFGYNLSAAWYGVGGFINDTLTAGVNYQRSIEIWVDENSTVIDTGGGGFTAGQLLPANTWTRVVQQFVGTGAVGSVYALAGGVLVTGTASVGVHVKLRRAQLVENPGGATLSYFDGSTPDTAVTRYDWTGAANASTSTATGLGAVRWDDLGKTAVTAVGLTAPSTSSYRIGTVFSGRITDLAAAWDFEEGGTVVKVTAEDQLAELGNRFVGDTPWLAERLDQRFAAIVAASGQAVNYRIDPAPAALPVTWRDVDKKAAAELLRELANSAGAPLWPSTNYATGPFLTIEDLDARPAMRILTGPPPIHITLDPDAADYAVEISACSVLLDPVEWQQSVEDNVTEVDVTWREQTLDNDGQLKPTDRTVAVIDAEAELVVGRRRASVATQLSQLAPAQALAEATLARLSDPGWRIAGLIWQTGDELLSPDELEVMMTILDSATRIGLPIVLTDLPEWSPVAIDQPFLDLFLEGLKATFDRGYWTLELLTSSASGQGSGSVRWDDLPSDWRWDDFDPSVTWNDLYGVGL